MYALKPILIEQKVELPSSMYSVKPINNSTSTANVDMPKNNSEKSEVELLEERQTRILAKLDELKQTLISMRGNLNLCAKPQQKDQQQPAKQQKQIQKKPIDNNNLAEVVVNAHPQNVPYSLLALKNLWTGRLFLQAEIFTHSSIAEKDLTNESKAFSAKILQSTEKDYKLPTLKVTIIWKDVETTQFISSPSKLIPVYGEINLLRFFNRIGPNEFFYEIDDHEANLHDQVLDICYQLSKKHTDEERQQFVQKLSGRLGKEQFFNNASSLSISDVAVSSILKKLYSNNVKPMPANLSSWLQKISSVAGY